MEKLWYRSALPSPSASTRRRRNDELQPDDAEQQPDEPPHDAERQPDGAPIQPPAEPSVEQPVEQQAQTLLPRRLR